MSDLADNTGIAVFGLAAGLAAAPATGKFLPLVWRGLANEASLLKYIPKKYLPYTQTFVANMGLQVAFNGKNADVYDAATSTINPWVALFTNSIVNYKPLAGDVAPTIGADAPEVMAQRFLISAPFTLLGMTVNTVQPNFTTDYLINVTEKTVDSSMPDLTKTSKRN